MKKLTPPFVICLFILLVNCSSDEASNNVINPPIDSNGDITSILSKFDTIKGLSYAIDGNFVEFTTNGLPSHNSPYWEQDHPLYETYN